MHHASVWLALAVAPVLFGCDKPKTALALRDPVHDFGLVELGKTETLQHTFRFENTGVDSLSLQLRPECGCTTIADSVSLLPGETTGVPVSLIRPPIPGPFNKAILVLDDQGAPLGSCSLIGEVAINSSMRFFPSRVDFGEVHPGDTHAIRVTRWDHSEIHLKEIECPRGLKLGAVSGSGTNEVSFELLPDSQNYVPDFEDLVKVVTQSDEHPVAYLPVKYAVPDVFCCISPTVFLASAEMAENTRARIGSVGCDCPLKDFLVNSKSEFIDNCQLEVDAGGAIFLRMRIADDIVNQPKPLVASVGLSMKEIDLSQDISIVFLPGN